MPDSAPMGAGLKGGDPLARPIFVVAPPRAGARPIARALDAIPGTWTAPGGAGALLSGVTDLDSPERGGRLLAADCRPEIRERLHAHLRAQVPSFAAPDLQAPRLFDASPRNALMIPFLQEAFPDATFVYAHRRPAAALAESLVLWRAGSATTYPDLPGWPGPPWSFLLVPSWQELIGRPLAEIATEQWVRTMRILTADLERLPPHSWCVSDRDALTSNTRAELGRLLGFLGIDPGYAAAAMFAQQSLPELSASDVSAAGEELAPYLARTDGLAAQAGDWIAPRRSRVRNA
jgi:Sulfotransferase family